MIVGGGDGGMVVREESFNVFKGSNDKKNIVDKEHSSKQPRKSILKKGNTL